jgi:hypothetical protein
MVFEPYCSSSKCWHCGKLLWCFYNIGTRRLTLGAICFGDIMKLIPDANDMKLF